MIKKKYTCHYVRTNLPEFPRLGCFFNPTVLPSYGQPTPSYHVLRFFFYKSFKINYLSFRRSRRTTFFIFPRFFQTCCVVSKWLRVNRVFYHIVRVGQFNQIHVHYMFGHFFTIHIVEFLNLYPSRKLQLPVAGQK